MVKMSGQQKMRWWFVGRLDTQVNTVVTVLVFIQEMDAYLYAVPINAAFCKHVIGGLES